MFGSNVHYYDRPIINSMFELQNVVLSFTTPLMLFTKHFLINIIL